MLLAAVVAMLVLAAPAGAFRLGRAPLPVGNNPADHLVDLAPDPEVYDPATHCTRMPKPGMTAFVGWLQRHADGVFWGTYRCERWGPHEASLHAEGRAVDWHLDVSNPSDRHAARRLIELFLAPDKVGTPHAQPSTCCASTSNAPTRNGGVSCAFTATASMAARHSSTSKRFAGMSTPFEGSSMR